MTAQAAKIGAVTDYATGFVQVQLAGSVVTDEVGHMTGRFEVGVFGVAFLATKGVIDVAMADDAISHFRHVGGTDLYRIRQAAVAGLAGIAGVEVAAQVAGGLKVGLLVDGGGDDGRDIAHFEVQGVAKGYDAGVAGRGDVAALVAGGAGGLDGKEIVGRFGAGGGRAVAGCAV